MPPSLDLELVKSFLAVVDARSFKDAAARLNRTPAAVSLQIKRLEEILGRRLLDRSNQGVSLTRAGMVLREKGQRLMALNHELLGEIREDEILGKIAFGAPADYASALLGQLLPIFQRELPRVEPHITLDLSRTLRRKITAGTLDLAIVAREFGSTEGIDLWVENCIWCGNSRDPDGCRRVGLLAADCVMRDRALADLEAAGEEHLVVLESQTVSALEDAVASGFCQALLPLSAAAGLNRAAKPRDAPVPVTFALIAGPGLGSEKLDRIAARFRDELVHQAAGNPGQSRRQSKGK